MDSKTGNLMIAFMMIQSSIVVWNMLADHNANAHLPYLPAVFTQAL